MTVLELDDIQGLVARGYPNLTAASYVLVQIEDPAAARVWLANLADQVTAANARPEAFAVNVAFMPAGFKKLGLPDEALDGFSNEFMAGMTTPHRRRELGDASASVPDGWLWGGPNTPGFDLLLLLFARDEATLAARFAALSASFAMGGVSGVLKLDSLTDLGGREHFGFADGISQPTIDGLSSRKDIPANTIRPGEFILGYENEYGRYTTRPLLKPEADPGSVLPPDVEGSGQADLGRNGTYLVFRQLAQDVHRFWGFVDQATRRPDGSSDPDRATFLAAKIVGRWPGGAPLTLAPDADDESLATANDFTYQYADEIGLNCPIGSHVRRAHPRDSLDPSPGTSRSVALDKRHRLLRRGREYGPRVAFEDRFGPAPADDQERGLYFIALCGNLARQFEMVQHTWVNNPRFHVLYDEPDPLVGNHEDGGPANFSVPAEPVRIRYTNLPRFVTTRGGAYFFLPGIRGLKFLSAYGVESGKASLPVGS